MPIPEDQDMEALEEEFFFNYLPSNFPKEFGELCLIPPLDKNKDLIRTVQLNLGEIIFRYRKRFAENKDYFVRNRAMYSVSRICGKGPRRICRSIYENGYGAQGHNIVCGERNRSTSIFRSKAW